MTSKKNHASSSSQTYNQFNNSDLYFQFIHTQKKSMYLVSAFAIHQNIPSNCSRISYFITTKPFFFERACCPKKLPDARLVKKLKKKLFFSLFSTPKSIYFSYQQCVVLSSPSSLKFHQTLIRRTPLRCIDQANILFMCSLTRSLSLYLSLYQTHRQIEWFLNIFVLICVDSLCRSSMPNLFEKHFSVSVF